MWAEVDVGINLLNQDRDGLNYIQEKSLRSWEIIWVLFLMLKLTFRLEYTGNCSNERSRIRHCMYEYLSYRHFYVLYLFIRGVALEVVSNDLWKKKYDSSEYVFFNQYGYAILNRNLDM